MKYRATRAGDVTVDGRPRALFEGQVYELDEAAAADADWLVAQPPSGGESAGAEEAPTEAADEAPKKAPARRRRRSRKAGDE